MSLKDLNKVFEDIDYDKKGKSTKYAQNVGKLKQCLDFFLDLSFNATLKTDEKQDLANAVDFISQAHDILANHRL